MDLDQDVRTAESLSDEVIIRQVMSENGMRLDDEEEERSFVPLSSGIAAMSTVIKCIEQLETATYDDMKTLKTLLSKLEDAQAQTMAQRKITDLFQKI